MSGDLKSSNLDRFSVLGVWVDPVSIESTVRTVERWVETGERRYISTVNAHAVVEALRDEGLRGILNRSGLAVPDGMPLVWLGRLAGRRMVHRVYGPDLTLAVCEMAARRKFSSFFVGGGPGVAEALATELSRRFPGFRSVGAYCPPFRELTAAEDEELVRRIESARPDLVWVGLGCPKQDQWMASHRDRLDASVLIGVGAAFDFHTGRVRQAPRWMRDHGAEWLFRLAQEPRRLWRRYLVYNPLFALHVAAQRLGLRRYPPGRPPLR